MKFGILIETNEEEKAWIPSSASSSGTAPEDIAK